jgi:hypothetical protein
LFPKISRFKILLSDFKCTYNMLKCEGLKGQCECEDKTICRWTGDDYYNENCPCGGSYGSKKRYGNRDDI